MNSQLGISSSHHVVLFPYMSKGHIIPILGLARLLLKRSNITVTIFTTPATKPFIQKSLCNTTATIIDLQFPQNIPEIPAGVESLDKVPSLSLFVPFTRATKLMQPEFERRLEILPPVSFMVSDGFLWWTLESATKFGFPRVGFFGMNCYSFSVCTSIGKMLSLISDDESISVPDFPWIKVTRSEIAMPAFIDPEPKGPEIELFADQMMSIAQSQGMLVNSFYDLETEFVEYCNRKKGIKYWCVGPLSLAQSPQNDHEADCSKKTIWIQWLDQKQDQGISVLYVAFGSQAEISTEQMKEIATGLEESEVNFLWVTREKESDLGQGFEERVKERGIVVRDWVNQTEILAHKSVKGFLSHCGWNSALESICAGVPILAWPMTAEQPLNAKLLVDEIKIGLRVETSNGKIQGLVSSQELKEKVKALMEGEAGTEVKKKAKEYADLAKKAMDETTGSSWCNLDMLINEMSKMQQNLVEKKQEI